MIKYGGTTEMPVTAWFNIQDHPIQRNTEEHAAFAKKRHLKDAHPSHALVNAVRLHDNIYKGDGHTRGYLWETGDLDRPKSLIVHWWDCDTMQEVEQMYRTFDNRGAADTARDDAYGAMRKYGLEFESTMLRQRRYINGMKKAYRAAFGGHRMGGADIIDVATGAFVNELQLLDKCAPRSAFFSSGVVSAALLTLAAYGEKAMPFWQAYSANAGSKVGDVVDAVEALHILVERSKRHKRYGDSEDLQITGKAISCCLRYIEGGAYSTGSQGGVNVKRTKDLGDIKKRIMVNRNLTKAA